ncbi:MAG: glycosyltransferase [Pyrinomonadaceae bacterium]
MKPKILQLINNLQTDGSERQAIHLTRLLSAEKSYDVRAACLNGEGVLRGEIERLGIGEIPEFPLASFYDANFLRQVHRCARFLRDNKIQVIQTSDFYTNIFGMAAGALAKTPVRIAAKRETEMRTKAQKFIEQRAFNFARAIVVNAEAVKNSLIKEGVPADKIVTIYNGLDLEKYAPPKQKRDEILRELELPQGENLRFVVIVANFRSTVKNQKMFLRAARKVKENFPSARFVLAGEGELLNETKKFAVELGLRNETFFTDRCADVSKLLSIADICVLSSTTEGFSNSILEYMAARKPIVATDVGGAREAIIEGKTGFLVDSNDDGQMAKRLEELLQNPEKAKKMGEAGRKIAEEKFSAEAQLKNTLALYEKLLRAKRKD